MSARRPARAFAIIPAAGLSQRMGAPKLLLPVQGTPLITHTIAAWQSAGLKPYVVVKTSDDQLAQLCRDCGATVIQPAIDPPEMKTSVQIAIDYIERTEHPQPHDAWLLAPADMPHLSPAIIRRLVFAHAGNVSEFASILVPVLAGKRGHPVLFPWPLATEVAALGAEEGINAIVSRSVFCDIHCDDLAPADAFIDIDTPADYDQLR